MGYGVFMGADQLWVYSSSKDQAEGVEGMGGRGVVFKRAGFWWEMGPKSTTLPVAALGLGGRAGSLPNAMSVTGPLEWIRIWYLHWSRQVKSLLPTENTRQQKAQERFHLAYNSRGV